jgi:hypothetical protein
MLASLLTPLVASAAFAVGPEWMLKVPEWHLKATLAAAVGGFAQVILVKIRGVVAGLGPKGAPDA